MAHLETESWSARAKRLLSEGRRHNGAARQALLDLLDSQPCALSAVEMEDLLRTGDRPVGRASIYRILEELESLDLVQRVQVGQSMARYEPVRGDHEHHHHLVCDTCGTVMPFTDPDLEQAIKSLSGRVPMRVDEHEIVLRGSCEDCT